MRDDALVLCLIEALQLIVPENGHVCLEQRLFQVIDDRLHLMRLNVGAVEESDRRGRLEKNVSHINSNKLWIKGGETHVERELNGRYEFHLIFKHKTLVGKVFENMSR